LSLVFGGLVSVIPFDTPFILHIARCLSLVALTFLLFIGVVYCSSLHQSGLFSSGVPVVFGLGDYVLVV